jgi:hypothetical protein
MTMVPPAEFVHPPTIPVIERVMRQEEVDDICHKVMPGMFERMKIAHAEGCSHRDVVEGKTVRCFVWVIDNELVKKHELAHCNGWPADHSGGIPDHPWGWR